MDSVFFFLWIVSGMYRHVGEVLKVVGPNFFGHVIIDMTYTGFSIENLNRSGEATAEPEKIFWFLGQKVIVFV